MMDKLISIIIPVYNTEKYLRRCLDSVLAQTFKDIEIILINDGSTDNSLEVCKEYASKDKRIKFLNQSNQGISVVRNVGINNSTGNYIGFVDSDDSIQPTMYELLYNALITNDADIAYCNYFSVDENGQSKVSSTSVLQSMVISGVDATKLLFRDKALKSFPWNKLYKKVLFSGLQYPENRVYEDVAIAYKLFYSSRRIILLADFLYNYNQRSNNITSELATQFAYKSYYDVFLISIEKYNFCLQNNNLIDFLNFHYVSAVSLSFQTLKSCCISSNFQNFYLYKVKCLSSINKIRGVLSFKWQFFYFSIIYLPYFFFFIFRFEHLSKDFVKRLIK